MNIKPIIVIKEKNDNPFNVWASLAEESLKKLSVKFPAAEVSELKAVTNELILLFVTIEDPDLDPDPTADPDSDSNSESVVMNVWLAGTVWLPT